MTSNDGDAGPLLLPRAAQLAEAFVGLADTLVADYDVVDLLDRLVITAVALLDATAAGLLLLDQRGGMQLVASSSEESRLLELFQLQDEEGPCLDCVRSGAPVALDDVAVPGPWPRFSREAERLGFRSVYAVPLRLRSEVIGGMNLFREVAAPLSPDERRVAQALADVATIGVLQQRSVHRVSLLAEQLQTALDSRITIEQAKGVLTERGQIDMDAAYQALRAYARDNNLGLSRLADDVVRGTVDLAAVLAAGARTRRGNRG